MHMCGLQLERGETRELPATSGAFGPMTLSGGAITTVTYRVFDRDADKVDKAIRSEPWRAFAQVTMRITIDRDPEFEVVVDEKPIEARACHKAPGIALIRHLSTYFPILPKAYLGGIYKPITEATQ
jgi:hypothetical protein